MAEYIEREKAIDYLMEIIDRPNHPEWLWTDEICGSLNTIPAADVRPVVRALAVKIFDDPWTGKMFTTCSACCGKIGPKDNFCKHCGADMRPEPPKEE